MAHGQWKEVEARGVLEAWRKSGASIEPFARGRGLVPQRLYWWKVTRLPRACSSGRMAVAPVFAEVPRWRGDQPSI
jgi:hypothetical protein